MSARSTFCNVTSLALTAEVQVRIEKIHMVYPSLLELERLSMSLVEEEPASLLGCIWQSLIGPDLNAAAIRTFSNYCFFLVIIDHSVVTSIMPIHCANLFANPQCKPTAECWSVKPRLIRVGVAFQARVDELLHDLEGKVEARWQPVADGVVEVVSPYEIGGRDCDLGYKGECK